MSIYNYLKKDHQEVKELIKKITDLEPSSTQKINELFNQLKTEILLHSKAEEKVFYEPLKAISSTKKEISDAKKEHTEVEEILERLSTRDLNGAAWSQLFKSMSDALLHHINEEENDIFDDAKKIFSKEEETELESAMKKEKTQVQKQLAISLREEA